MRQHAAAAAFVMAVLAAACGGSKQAAAANPAAPSPAAPAAQTRVVVLGGNLAFGNIQVGQVFRATMTVSNTGTAPLTVSSISGPASIQAVLTPSWTSGTVPAGGSQTVTWTFAPLMPTTYSGTITVNGDQTGGTNSIGFSGTGSLAGLPLWHAGGSGDTVLNMPRYVTRVRVVGTYGGFTSNFIVKVDGRLLVNELLGTGWSQTRYDGTLLTGTTETSAGVLAITNSSGVSWSFDEVR